jgi:hypothetical protein
MNLDSQEILIHIFRGTWPPPLPIIYCTTPYCNLIAVWIHTNTVVLYCTMYTDKKEYKIFLIYKEIQRVGCKVIYV